MNRIDELKVITQYYWAPLTLGIIIGLMLMILVSALFSDACAAELSDAEKMEVIQIIHSGYGYEECPACPVCPEPPAGIPEPPIITAVQPPVIYWQEGEGCLSYGYRTWADFGNGLESYVGRDGISLEFTHCAEPGLQVCWYSLPLPISDEGDRDWQVQLLCEFATGNRSSSKAEFEY